VRVKAALPATALLGLRLVMEAAWATTENEAALETAPPGFVTVTFTEVGEAMRLAATEAVSLLLLA